MNDNKNPDKDNLTALESAVFAAIKEARDITNRTKLVRELLFNATKDFCKSKISPVEFGWNLHEIFGALIEIETATDTHIVSCNSILAYNNPPKLKGIAT